MNKPKVVFISSTGGHLSEMLQLKELFNRYDYHIITEKTKNNLYLKEKYPNRVSYTLYGTKHNMFTYPFIGFTNIIKSLYFYFKYKPDYVITTGTHNAVPLCFIAHFFRKKVIYIETLANIKTKTLSGKIVYRIADLFIVQWRSMLELYPKAVYGGWIY